MVIATHFRYTYRWMCTSVRSGMFGEQLHLHIWYSINTPGRRLRVIISTCSHPTASGWPPGGGARRILHNAEVQGCCISLRGTSECILSRLSRQPPPLPTSLKINKLNKWALRKWDVPFKRHIFDLPRSTKRFFAWQHPPVARVTMHAHQRLGLVQGVENRSWHVSSRIWITRLLDARDWDWIDDTARGVCSVNGATCYEI